MSLVLNLQEEFPIKHACKCASVMNICKFIFTFGKWFQQVHYFLLWSMSNICPLLLLFHPSPGNDVSISGRNPSGLRIYYCLRNVDECQALGEYRLEASLLWLIPISNDLNFYLWIIHFPRTQVYVHVFVQDCFPVLTRMLITSSYKQHRPKQSQLNRLSETVTRWVNLNASVVINREPLFL